MRVNVFPFLSHKRVSLLLNAPHLDKIALTNGVSKSEFDHFQNLVNQQDTVKVSNFDQESEKLSFEVFFLFFANFSRLTVVNVTREREG